MRARSNLGVPGRVDPVLAVARVRIRPTPGGVARWLTLDESTDGVRSMIDVLLDDAGGTAGSKVHCAPYLR